MTFQYLDQAIQFEQFSFLSDYSPVASTMVVWLSALVVLFIFLAIVKKLSEGSKSDIDDVTIGITSKYITIILLSVGVVSVIFSLDLNSKITDIALTLNNFVVTV